MDDKHDQQPQKTCGYCGIPLPHGRQKYCSKACQRKAQAKRKLANTGKQAGNPEMMWHTTCVTCGAAIYRPIKCIRCESCQAEVNRQRNAICHSKGAKRPLGSIDICQRCGQEYIVEGGMQKYCKSCSHIATQKSIREHKRDYMADMRADPVKGEAIKQGKRVVPRIIPCSRCGKPFETKTRAAYCSDACRKAAIKEYQKAYSSANAEKKAARQRERTANLTPEQRSAINAKARANYAKRKAKKSKNPNKE